jgi:large subunit ribosomal protein L3
MKFILGLKVGMSQMFDEKGDVIPVTLIEAGPCQVTQIKTKEKDGYETVQVGFKKIEKEKKIKKPLKKKPFRFLREFKNPPAGGGESKIGQEIDEEKSSSQPFPRFRLGQVIDVSIFQAGDRVKVSGISKGKGFAGGVKRWGFHGRPATHGTKHELRTPGSVGTSFPERVIKGRKMPGRMGSARVTVKELKVVKVDKENNLLAVKGAVPGRKGALLEVISTKQEA